MCEMKPSDMELAEAFARFLLHQMGLVAGAFVAYFHDIPDLAGLDSDSTRILLGYRNALSETCTDQELVVRTLSRCVIIQFQL